MVAEFCIKIRFLHDFNLVWYDFRLALPTSPILPV